MRSITLGQAAVLVEQVLHASALFSMRVATTLHEIVHGAGLGENIERNVDVEAILDLHDEVHDGDRIDTEIAGDVGRRLELDALLVERGEQAANLREYLVKRQGHDRTDPFLLRSTPAAVRGFGSQPFSTYHATVASNPSANPISGRQLLTASSRAPRDTQSRW